MTLLKAILPNKRVEWETMTVQSEWDVNFPIEKALIQASFGITEMILANHRYRMYRYLDETNRFKIGYGYGNPDVRYGYTEEEAFAAFMKELKKKERDLQSQLPLATISQTNFDALLSLYFQTGKWRTVDSNEGTYDLYNTILTERWTLAADMIANGKTDRQMRFAEARVMKLADYGSSRDRFWLRTDGIYDARNAYKAGISDPVARRQAEYAYYRTTGGFLPNMPELKKREVIKTLPRTVIQN